MKRILHLALLSTFILLFGCDTSKKDFDKAMEFYSTQSLDNFLHEHPEGRWADSARMHIAFIKADSIRRFELLTDFKKQYPKSSLSSKIEIVIDSLSTINGGCLITESSVPDSISEKLSEIVKENNLWNLYLLLKKEPALKEKIRPQIQSVIKEFNPAVLFAYEDVDPYWDDIYQQKISGLNELYLQDSLTSIFSYELSILNALEWRKINEYFAHDMNHIRNWWAEVKTQWRAGSITYNTFQDSYKETRSHLIVTFKQKFYYNMLFAVDRLENYPLDVCAKEQYWQHLSKHLIRQAKGDIAIKVSDSYEFTFGEKYENGKQLLEPLDSIYSIENHQLVKKIAGGLIKKLKDS